MAANHLGTPSSHDGAFGAAESLIAELHGADRAVMSVTGSSGSNQSVLLMLSRLAPDASVLVARNAHHSTIHALMAFGVGFEFLPAGYDAEFEALLPPTPAEVAAALARRPDVRAVLLTSPTYEGLAAHIREIADVVHADDPERLLVVDEAWGSHLAFHEALPTPAIQQGADLVIQSTHKQGGSLQQTGIILWNTARVDSELMVEAHAQWTTTSPSFHLLASIDAAHRELAANGRELLGRSIERTQHLTAQIAEHLPRLEAFTTAKRLDDMRERVAGHDLTKATFALTRYGRGGHDLASALIAEPHNITLEKNGLNTITFLLPFQLPERAEDRAVAALVAELEGALAAPVQERRLPSDPFATLTAAPAVDPSRASRSARRDGELVPVAEAVGRISAEAVEAFPPGIPVLLPGFEVTREAIDYLAEVRDCGGTIHGADPKLTELRVLRGT
jgi:arginine/lysine/ornithine decarboxylase